LLRTYDFEEVAGSHFGSMSRGGSIDPPLISLPWGMLGFLDFDGVSVDGILRGTHLANLYKRPLSGFVDKNH